jgi:hypothetical protein
MIGRLLIDECLPLRIKMATSSPTAGTRHYCFGKQSPNCGKLFEATPRPPILKHAKFDHFIEYYNQELAT